MSRLTAICSMEGWCLFPSHAEEVEGDVDDDVEEVERFGAQLQEEKEMALNESMEKLAVGIGEAKVGDSTTRCIH